MVIDAPVPKLAGARPPTFGGPPLGTTFSNEPDDRDRDMLVHLKDDVDRLTRQALAATSSSVPSFMRLLEQRREWIKGEMRAEALLDSGPAAPLGIADNPYDLSSLSLDPMTVRERRYQAMLDAIETAEAALWERMLPSGETS